MTSFKRITSSGNIIPQVEGLRFIGIITVVIYHLNVFIKAKDSHTYQDQVDYSLLDSICMRGYYAVEQFFVLSGFILGLLFAKAYNGIKEKSFFKAYFTRRFTRIEPPYIIVMTALGVASVLYVKQLPAYQVMTSYLVSLFYLHNIYPGELSQLNPVTWSLEIEVQFYILAPLIALIFKISNKIWRRVVLSSSIIISTLFFDKLQIPFINLINYIEYFLTGFLLADFFMHQAPQTLRINKAVASCAGLLCFGGIWLLALDKLQPHKESPLQDIAQLMLVFTLYYLILVKGIWSFLKFRLVTIIGGMCYTIYLLHYPLISAFGNPLMRVSFSPNSMINKSCYVLLLTLIIGIFSTAFYLWIERPCMNKDWPRLLLHKIKKL